MQLSVLPRSIASLSGSCLINLVPPPPPSPQPMTTFMEHPVDPNWHAMMCRSLEAQSDDYFRPYFDGRVPTEAEKQVYIQEAARRLTPKRVFANNLYRVELLDTPIPDANFLHLAITRHDGLAVKEWRHLQQIKNEIAGPECEAMEIFPAESRLVDTGNQYHLWVHRDPKFRFPVGWWLRLVRHHPIRLIPETEVAVAPPANAA